MSRTKLDSRPEEKKTFTDFLRERPLDVKLRKLVRRALKAKKKR